VRVDGAKQQQVYFYLTNQTVNKQGLHEIRHEMTVIKGRVSHSVVMGCSGLRVADNQLLPQTPT
jgi:hypothetical protein